MLKIEIEMGTETVEDTAPATPVNRFAILAEKLQQARHEEIELPERACLDSRVSRLEESLREATQLPTGAEPVVDIHG